LKVCEKLDVGRKKSEGRSQKKEERSQKLEERFDSNYKQKTTKITCLTKR